MLKKIDAFDQKPIEACSDKLFLGGVGRPMEWRPPFCSLI